MPTTYNADGSAVIAHAQVAVTNPVDLDALSATSNNAAIQALADEVEHLKVSALLRDVVAGDTLTGKFSTSGANGKIEIANLGEFNVNSGGLANIKSGGEQKILSGGVVNAESGAIINVKSGAVLKLAGEIHEDGNNNQVAFDSLYRLMSHKGFIVDSNQNYNYDTPGKTSRKFISPLDALASGSVFGSYGFGAGGWGAFQGSGAVYLFDLKLPAGAYINSIYVGALDATTPASTIKAYLYRSETSAPAGAITGTYENSGTTSGFNTGAVTASLTWSQINFKGGANQFVPSIGNYLLSLQSTSLTLAYYGIYVDYSCTSIQPST